LPSRKDVLILNDGILARPRSEVQLEKEKVKMHFKHPLRGNAKESLLGVLLCFALFASTTPITPALSQEQPEDQQTQTQNAVDPEVEAAFEASFQTEFLDYAATHTDDELKTYVQERLATMQSEAIDFAPPNVANTAEEGGDCCLVVFDPGPGPGSGGTGGNGPDWQRLNACLQNGRRECISMYQSDLATAAATTTAVIAGCAALAAGPQLALCLGAAAGHYAASVLAAQLRFDACITRVGNDCHLQYGPP